PIAFQGDRRSQRPPRPTRRIARGAAPLSPAGAAPAMAERGPPHPHGVHHPRPAARGDRGNVSRVRKGGRRTPTLASPRERWASLPLDRLGRNEPFGLGTLDLPDELGTAFESFAGRDAVPLARQRLVKRIALPG